jgi:hypothetical protein
MDFQVILWIGAGVVLVSAVVSSLLYKTKTSNRRKVDARRVASEIFWELQDKFFRDGTDDLVDVYQLGQQLGFSTEEVRAALSEFRKSEQMDVVIFTERHVKLGIRGQVMPRHERRSGGDRQQKQRKT